MAVSALVAASFNKRCLLRYFIMCGSISILSAGRGGEGEEKYCSAMIVVWGWRQEILEPASPSVVASCGCRNFLPEGWPRRAQQLLLLELLLPLLEDIPQLRRDIERPYFIKWPSPRWRVVRPCLESVHRSHFCGLIYGALCNL